MSLFFKIFNGGEKARKNPCQKDEIEKLSEGEELLMKKKEFLKKRIAQELQIVKKNSTKNRGVALQALKRKKRYEKQLKYFDCAVKAMRFAHENIDIVSKLNDLTRGIRKEQDFGVEFDEDELLAELERLEKNLHESPFETDRMEETILFPNMSFTASASHPAKTEEDEVEADLEYLRRWMNELS